MIYAAYKNYLLNNSMAFSLRLARLRGDDATDKLHEALQPDAGGESLRAGFALGGVAGRGKRLDAQLAQLETSRSNRDKELQTLRADEQTYKKNSSRLAADERKVADRIRQKEREKQNAQKQLQRLVAEEARRNAGTKRTAAEERVRVELSNNFEQNEGKFPYPVSDGVIIDRFGKHPHPHAARLRR